MKSRPKKLGIAALLLLAVAAGAWLQAAAVYRLAPTAFLGQLTRVIAAPVFAEIYRGDLRREAAITSGYLIGDRAVSAERPLASWTALQGEVPGLQVQYVGPDNAGLPEVPFVYESTDLPYLRELRARYHFDEIVRGARDEYQAMLALGAWVGTRWDHGTDPLTGTRQVCDPIAVIEAGRQGEKYWCQIAAVTMVHAATAMGWQARLVTLSRDGYTWEHAVAELWSNEFDKWFVVDTDFNVVYERAGVPLSAFELDRDGLALQRGHELTVRPIAPAKPSLPLTDLMPFYRYVHIDMRNDWCSRKLPRGSPAGGDLATWWTVRGDFHRPLLTAMRRVDDGRLFDWKVNTTAIYGVAAERLEGGRYRLRIALAGYSPVFRAFEVSTDGGGWRPIVGARDALVLAGGAHSIAARVLTSMGAQGPVSHVSIELANPGIQAANGAAAGALPAGGSPVSEPKGLRTW